ncbi:MAG TPA: bacterioferritin [Bacteroidales bacterium]|jgi:bacterioferritin|nr:bacterioferritin [Bacteroidales bacterium]
MKGNAKIIDTLNALLREELTAVNQYFVHGEMCDNWGYEKLHKHIEKRSIEEMKHAEKLIKRILYLDGKPIVSELNKITIGATIEDQFKKDLDAEESAVRMYNDAIKLSTELLDGGTKELLDSIILDEENHADWLEAQLSQIDQMGVQNYLAGQIA